LTALFSPESKIISIVDDKPDITGLFRVALQTTVGDEYMHLQNLLWPLNILKITNPTMHW